MFKNYIKTAWRSLQRNKGIFRLNFIGLYISIVACLLIGLLILHETSFDKPTNNNNSIYRIVKTNTVSTGKTYSPVTQYPLATALRAALPGEKLIAQIHFQKEEVISFDNKKFKPDQLFESSFLDKHVASFYKTEKRTQQLFNLFTLLSIVINVLGLVGLLSFMIEQKTKEIGIRKVLAASVKDISFILSKDFLRLIIIAFFIAAPVAWLLMNK